MRGQKGGQEGFVREQVVVRRWEILKKVGCLRGIIRALIVKVIYNKWLLGVLVSKLVVLERWGKICV